MIIVYCKLLFHGTYPFKKSWYQQFIILNISLACWFLHLMIKNKNSLNFLELSQTFIIFFVNVTWSRWGKSCIGLPRDLDRRQSRSTFHEDWLPNRWKITNWGWNALAQTKQFTTQTNKQKPGQKPQY